jgi:hypothetical protein
MVIVSFLRAEEFYLTESSSGLIYACCAFIYSFLYILKKITVQYTTPVSIFQGEVVGKIIRMVEYAISIPDICCQVGMVNIRCEFFLFKRF